MSSATVIPSILHLPGAVSTYIGGANIDDSGEDQVGLHQRGRKDVGALLHGLLCVLLIEKKATCHVTNPRARIGRKSSLSKGESRRDRGSMPASKRRSR